MLHSDANKLRKSFTLDNINSITINTVSKIEKDLESKDLISLVFLLYDAHNVAWERLIIYQRVFKNIGNGDLNLLYDWAKLQNQNTPTWRYQFVEALTICQLYSIIRKLGFNVSFIKHNLMPNYLHVEHYINPMKKALYKLCENMTSKNLVRLQNTLKTYNIHTTQHKFGEIILLELICNKFITIERQNLEHQFQIDKLADIIEHFPDLKYYALSLRQIQNKYKNDTNEPEAASTSVSSSGTGSETIDDNKVTANAFKYLESIIEPINKEFCTKNLKTDTKELLESAYAIKDPKRVGFCHIINQEDFHLSEDSIDQRVATPRHLEKRRGSNRDSAILKETMTSLNFEVICHRNLKHKDMLEIIKTIVQYRVHPDHSIYMLCILSHGIQGHVFAADSVPVNVEHIKNLLDSSFNERNLEIPKVLIMQACRVNDEPEVSLVSDAPSGYFLPKLHFLVCWATAPELEAFRDEIKGSIFVQTFCYYIKQQAKHEHLLDIFTNAVNAVAKICTNLSIAQTPSAETSLRKKLYIQIPSD